MSDSEHDGDPSAILRAIDDEQRQAQRALSPNPVLLYTTWGVAWIVGFLAFYATFVPAERPVLPFAAGAAIGAAVLVGAIVLSAVHSARRGAGSRGPSMVQGAIYGNAFGVAFTLMGLLGWRLMSAGVSVETMLSYWLAASCLVVGILIVVGAAMWNDRSQLIFGCWTLAVGFVSLAVAPPHNLLVGVVGGVGFLVLAVLEVVRPRLTSGQIARATDG
ncbi:hypothetical protein [Microbacterium sp. No. 7]|uniref:hypothetical protein n=1 Tax=Microbacterium sp. No. 7 TaxID=1714373 RepID=UPI0006D1DE01|nr:hypothetical protein [Microbacterium sp. No. 7]ALJ18941.1 hypothetical protein AOA12_03065 [Microbacterium sp. No. 7]